MENLPRGLVSTSGNVSTELDGMEIVDIGDIVRLWRVYSINPAALEGDTGYRLQNVFWRIWGSDRLSSSIRGSTLARLFLRISEPGSLTPTQKSKAQKSEPLLPSFKREKPPDHANSSGNTGKAPLPPILKKHSTSSSHGESQKTTRLLLTDLGGRSVTRNPSHPPTPVPPSRPVMIGDGVSRQGQKKGFVVANKAKGSKRRPVVMRRKSSQQSSVASSTRCSTRAHSPLPVPSPPPQRIDEHPEELLTQSPDATNEPSEETSSDTNKEPGELTATFLAELKDLLNTEAPAPPQSIRLHLPPLGYFSATAQPLFDGRHLCAANYKSSASSLVETDFRTRFAERQRQEQQYYQAMSSSFGDPVLAEPGSEPFGIGTATTVGTNDTISPSRLGESQTEASTVATSIPGSHEDHSPTPFPSSILTGQPPSGAGNALFPQSPLSLPRGPGQLGFLIKQRHEETDEMSDD
ncbi:hypothetical protein ARAM_002875 [Aspergillus rambellii]|uniref:Uncharacterized protein n=1 Tax=Aspergillus rambellii TaxID=308745 RepID=A0A0F8U8K5_9EURO|nr:hypothetical protein ARAM_002875 [Aspergillus rambellii]